jgi:hypothetical protein
MGLKQFGLLVQIQQGDNKFRKFFNQVKAGTYRVIVDAKDPYKDVTLENLEVETVSLA